MRSLGVTAQRHAAEVVLHRLETYPKACRQSFGRDREQANLAVEPREARIGEAMDDVAVHEGAGHAQHPRA